METSLNNWIYKLQEINHLPDDCAGFVYLITNLANGKKYIGKKLSKFSKTTYKTVTLKNGTKKKKKIKGHIESDWRDYWGSSKELLKDIEALGHIHFRREILHICKTKAECSYIEAREQMDRRVLEDPKYYNNGIQLRVHGNHIMGKL